MALARSTAVGVARAGDLVHDREREGGIAGKGQQLRHLLLTDDHRLDDVRGDDQDAAGETGPERLVEPPGDVTWWQVINVEPHGQAA